MKWSIASRKRPLDVGHDAVARGCVAVAHRRHVPLLDTLAASGHDVAAEADDARGAVQVVERDRAGAGERRLEAVTGEALHRTGRQLRVRFGSGRYGADGEPALRREPPEVRRADHALGGAMQAHEEHP